MHLLNQYLSHFVCFIPIAVFVYYQVAVVMQLFLLFLVDFHCKWFTTKIYLLSLQIPCSIVVS